MLDFLKKADKGVEKVQLVVCGILMTTIMVLTFCMVFWRYVLNNSIVWAEEMLRYLMIWCVLVGAGLTTRQDDHVSMDVLQSFLERWPKVQAVHYVITRVIVFAFMIYLIGPTMELIHRAGNSTATSLTWLHKSAVYFSFICGIISINLSLLSQVPRKVYNLLHGIEDNDMILEAKAMAASFEKELAEDAANEEAQAEEPDEKNGGGDAQ